MKHESEKSLSFKARDAIEGVDPLFVERWSPRAFEKTDIATSALERIMDAARWSPSCFNEQPWRFYTSTAETFDKCLACLVDANQAWAKDASVIGFVVAKTHFARNGKENNWSAFDSGSAWMAMTLQARIEGLYTHGMAGVEFDRVADLLKLDPEHDKVLMAFVIGKAASRDNLTEEQLEKETPNARKALSEIWSPVK